MVDVRKILRFADAFGDLAGLERALWDGSPPSIEAPVQAPSAPRAPSAPDNTPPRQTPVTNISGYTRLTQTPGTDVQQRAQQILNQIRNQPIGTTVPFSMNGVNYMARLENHPPGPRNPMPHPGISLFVQPQNTQQYPGTPFFGGGQAQLSERSRQKISELKPPEFQQQVRQLLLRGIQAGLRPEIVEGYRSQERQEELYEQGRTKPGKIVTQTKESMHTKGMAVDIAQLDEKGNITYEPDDPQFWDKMGAIGRSLGLNWGGDWTGFKDRPHFQYNPK